MNIHTAGIVLAGMLVSSLTVGCAANAESSIDTESTEDAVRTARCPNDISLRVTDLDMRTYFGELSRREQYEPMKQISSDIAAEGMLSFEGTIKTKKSGRCTYESGAHASSAVLYTKGGKDIVRIAFEFRNRTVYLHGYPREYSPNLRFDDDSKARLVTALYPDPADPMDDVDASEAASPRWVTLGTGKVSAR